MSLFGVILERASDSIFLLVAADKRTQKHPHFLSYLSSLAFPTLRSPPSLASHPLNIPLPDLNPLSLSPSAQQSN